MPEQIPYGRQVIEDDDVQAVVDALRSDWLTTGPLVGEFESAFAQYVDAKHAVAVSNGTAALHVAVLAAGIGAGDEVIVPALTFAASANCARYVGATVVFADIDPVTLTLDVAQVASLITPRTRAIVTVDYAGLPSELDELMALASRHDLVVIEDACHALGAEYHGRRVGSIAHLSCFSLHPVKHMTSGEGGVVTTNDDRIAGRVRRLRNHGIDSDHRERERKATWRYEMIELGYNYRLTDIQCALALSQVRKLDPWLAHRRALAARYGEQMADIDALVLPVEPEDRRHAYHLYAVRFRQEQPAELRARVFADLRARGIGVNVHYLPVYLHPYYRDLGYRPGLCPEAERAYDGLLSLPMWHGMRGDQQDRVIESVREVLSATAVV